MIQIRLRRGALKVDERRRDGRGPGVRGGEEETRGEDAWGEGVRWTMR